MKIEKTIFKRTFSDVWEGTRSYWAERDPAEVERAERDMNSAEVKLTDGRSLSCSLVIGADGRNSPLRRSAKISVNQFRYDQTAIVCTVAHERSHNGVAVELFLPGGPFAMLPMTGHRTNIVWTERSDLAPSFLELEENLFLAEVQRRFGTWLGALKF